MKRHYPCWIVGIAGYCLLSASPVWAQQISGDGTLSTNVTSPDGRNFTITDGNRAGDNLFHSFKEFSVPTGGSAFFDNALDVKNIIGRVTGGAVSNINGLLRANGSANLFLLNPHGILFGPNAQLNIGGSFLGSTASSLRFADGREFSTLDPSSPPLLTVSVPVGLQYNQTANPINVQQSTLAVQPGQTLALVGGDVTLAGSNLTAPGGRVELGGLAGAGTVALSFTGQKLQLSFPEQIASEKPVPWANVSLTDQALVDASGIGGGDIQLTGRRVKLEDSRVEANTQGSEAGGDLNVSASESVELSSKSTEGRFDSGLFAETLGTGTAGDLNITTRKLVVQGEARASAATLSAGRGGNLSVVADSVELIGVDPPNDQTLGQLFTGLLTDAESTGAAGDLKIQTRQLTVRDGAQVSAATFGTGQGGNLTVVADSIKLLGVSPSDLVASGLFNAVQTTATGKTGDLTINTRRLVVRDGAQIFAGTNGVGDGGNLTVNASESVEATGVSPIILAPSGLFSTTEDDFISNLGLTAGRAGNLTVNTSKLIVRDGARVEAASRGKTGQAGDLTVNARELVELSGPGPANGTGGRTGLAAGTTGGSSNSGYLTVNTGQLIIRDGALLAVNNQGSGNAGNLFVAADSIRLDNSGSLSAEVRAGSQGNITLDANHIQLRHGSQITTSASNAATGGNINIDAGTLVALENSDIIANAFQGRGGNIKISAQGIFRSADSHISASSALGVNGVVEVQNLGLEQQNALVAPASNLVSTQKIVSGSCLDRRNAQRGFFVVTGNGGLPETPYDAMNMPYELTQVQPIKRDLSSTEQVRRTLPTTSWKLGNPIQPATSLVVAADGRVLLVKAPTSTDFANPQDLTCQVR